MDLMLFGIWWVWWAIGSSGLIVVALLIWLAPTILVAILKALLTFGFTTRIGAALLAGSIAFFVADVNRSRRDQADFALQSALYQQAQKLRDEKIAADTRTEVQAELAAQAKNDTATDNEVKGYHEEVHSVPIAQACDAVVRVGSNAGRLRAIAGETRSVHRPAGFKRVPAARKKAAHP